MRFAWIDERPFNYVDGGGTLTGCDVVLARGAFARMGVAFEPVHTVFEELLPGLAAGRWDVTTGVFITESRRERTSFTRPIWSLGDGILVRSSATPKCSGYKSIARVGSPLAVLRGQVQADHAMRHGFTPDALAYYGDYDSAVSAVRNEEVVGYASVALAHEAHLAAHRELDDLAIVAVAADEVPPAAGGFACASSTIRDALDQALYGILGDKPPPEPSLDPRCWATG